jgi:hypothetical protein
MAHIQCAIEVTPLNFIYVAHIYMRYIILTFLWCIHMKCAIEFSKK